jgi:hypothetical protein
MSRVAILQSNYIPWKGYFDIIRKVDTFVIYDEVQYTKNDWRNRNKIKTLNGLQWLTIPVRQTSLEQKIYETEVVNQIWRKKHLNSLKTYYSKAPCFKEMFPLVEMWYEGNETLLSEINVKFIKGVCEVMGIKTEIIDSRNLLLTGDKNERLIDACKKLNATTYLSGSAAKLYLREEDFGKNGIKVEWMEYSGYKEYPQLYPPFEHGVSILDMIFNIGNEARQYLK